MEFVDTSRRVLGIRTDVPRRRSSLRPASARTFSIPDVVNAFRCPSVDRKQFAILLFQTLGVAIRQGLEINGQTIFGGIAPSLDPAARILGPRSESPEDRTTLGTWNGHVMLIHPGVLQENNIMRIRAADATAANIDDFLVDNVVVVFKTAEQAGGAPRGGKKRAKKRKR